MVAGGFLGQPFFDATLAYARWCSNTWQTWWRRSAGADAIEAAQHARLGELVAFARAHSPFYRAAYRALPDDVTAIDALPVMTKRELMSRFDEWATDRRVCRRDIETFTADRAHIGERYLDRYIVWKSSGTTGDPALYVQDDDALAMYDAMIGVQLASGDVAAQYIANLVMNGGRAALIAATGDHFASVASWQRLCRSLPGIAARQFSILDPIGRIVDALNAYDPTYIASYPTMLTLLADERAAGRLRINPAVVWSAGEYLAPQTRVALERDLGCPVQNEYGASECMSIAFGCRSDWLHVNADWVIVEPVDADYRATPAGETSDTVLLTNLANRVQPVIRYDLGDAVIARPDRCECGSPLPAIRVAGRCDDIVTMRANDGRMVRLPPLALTTVVEDAIDVYRYQIVERAHNALSLRFAIEDPQRRSTLHSAAATALHRYLARQGVFDVEIALDPRAPEIDRRSGKLRQVIVSQSGEPAAR